MTYSCCFSLQENLDFLDFLQKSFITSTTGREGGFNFTQTINIFMIMIDWAVEYSSKYFSQQRLKQFNIFFIFSQSISYLNKIQSRVNKTLSMDVESHMNSFNQSECVVSAKHSYASLWFYHSIELRHLNDRVS